MNIIIDDKTATGIIENATDFEPEHVFECGQAFRWFKEEDGSYTTVAHGRIINLKRQGDNVIVDGITNDDYDRIWKDYFDLNRDYSAIKMELSKDDTLAQAVKYGYGIRILNQEPFETMISFIISANNQIPRIMNSIRIISERYGDYIGEYKGRKLYSFPTPEQLAMATPADLREFCRVGFRDERIVETSKIVRDKGFDIESAFSKDSMELRKQLVALPGIGPKVADCIMLFAFHKKETFPVDVWIKRVMEELYLKEETRLKDIGNRAKEIFGDNAGFAQQYLFYYGRENKIGK